LQIEQDYKVKLENAQKELDRKQEEFQQRQMSQEDNLKNAERAATNAKHEFEKQKSLLD
jgi:multidrug resistance efflux pump